MKKHKNFIPKAFKVLIALASFTGTIGLWNFLSNKDYLAQSSNPVTAQPASGITDLPPIPTLVPLVTIDQLLNQSGISSDISQQPSSLRKVEVAQPATAIQAPSAPENSTVIIPAPVTVTRSSR